MRHEAGCHPRETVDEYLHCATRIGCSSDRVPWAHRCFVEAGVQTERVWLCWTPAVSSCLGFWLQALALSASCNPISAGERGKVMGRVTQVCLHPFPKTQVPAVCGCRFPRHPAQALLASPPRWCRHLHFPRAGWRHAVLEFTCSPPLAAFTIPLQRIAAHP